jgi:hypothetical protein
MRRLFLAGALLLTSCGPKSLELPPQPIDRAATCGVVAAAEARAGTTDVKAPLPFASMETILHYPLLAGSAGDSFSADTASAVQSKMTELQERIIAGKWQDLVPACKAAFPATAMTKVELSADRFQAQLGCYELADFIRSALEKGGEYDNELSSYHALSMKLDTALGPGMRSRGGTDFKAQQNERHKALARIAKAGPPTEVMRQCVVRFG